MIEAAADAATAARARSAPAAGRLFPWAGYAFIAFFLAALVAFWPQYFSRIFRVDGFRHFHAAVMTSWFGLLIAQPLLVKSGQSALHRKLGRTSFVLAPLAVLSIILLTHHSILEISARAVADLGREGADAFFAGQTARDLGLAAQFAVIWGLAILYRRRTALHGRFMLGTGFALVGPVVGRLLRFFLWPGVWRHHPTLHLWVPFGLADLVVLWLIWRERHADRGRIAFPVILGVMGAQQLALYVLPHVGAWRAFTDWFLRLPLT